jgi:outer membrane protein OmpA-like peptidoglycan-associated protein
MSERTKINRYWSRHASLATALAWVLAGCGADTQPQAPAPTPADPMVASQPASTGNGTAQVATDQSAAPASEADVSVEPAGFDPASLAVSTAALGAFPYVSLPDGYLAKGEKTFDFAQMAVWTGERHQIVEGRLAVLGIVHDRKAGKAFSLLEVTRNFEHVITQAGGVKVFSGKVPNAHRNDADAKAAMADYHPQAKCWANDEVQVYALRRAEGLTWIRVCGNRGFAGLMVADVGELTPTAALLPASTLKQQLDGAGKVALQVNFATDKTDILADSLPQIDQVVKLLQDDPELQLAVNGHTDNTGDAARNKRLSDGRAQAVVKALVGKGIDTTRLEAKGFGDTQPVAGNDTDAGKAQNRRVELVKR